MSVAILSEHRATNGRFAPGRSGNPAGRPKGARNKATLIAESMLADSSEALAGRAVETALGGDGAMVRFLLSRFLPPASAADQPVTLDLAPGEETDPAAVLAKAIRAMADGELTPKEALHIGRLLAIFAKLKRISSPPREKRPVSDLYFSRDLGKSKRPLPNPPPQAGEGASIEPSPARGGGQGGGNAASFGKPPVSRIPLPLAGEGGARVSGRVRASAERAESALTPTLSRKRERETASAEPVSDLYLPPRARRPDLFSTTAIGLASGMAGRHGAESPRLGLPI